MWWGEFYLGLTILVSLLAVAAEDKQALRVSVLILLGWILSNLVKGSAAYDPMHNILLDAASLCVIWLLSIIAGRPWLFWVLMTATLAQVFLHALQASANFPALLYAQIYNLLFAIPLVCVAVASILSMLARYRERFDRG